MVVWWLISALIHRMALDFHRPLRDNEGFQEETLVNGKDVVIGGQFLLTLLAFPILFPQNCLRS